MVTAGKLNELKTAQAFFVFSICCSYWPLLEYIMVFPYVFILFNLLNSLCEQHLDMRLQLHLMAYEISSNSFGNKIVALEIP